MYDRHKMGPQQGRHQRAHFDSAALALDDLSWRPSWRPFWTTSVSRRERENAELRPAGTNKAELLRQLWRADERAQSTRVTPREIPCSNSMSPGNMPTCTILKITKCRKTCSCGARRAPRQTARKLRARLLSSGRATTKKHNAGKRLSATCLENFLGAVRQFQPMPDEGWSMLAQIWPMLAEFGQQWPESGWAIWATGACNFSQNAAKPTLIRRPVRWGSVSDARRATLRKCSGTLIRTAIPGDTAITHHSALVVV